jgi:MerR family transcriptional regulator, light-induced transcriptional regulator
MARTVSPKAELEVEYTVAAVARRLGVAPATLRTWDRRYGLGPTSHNAGEHRKYSETDLLKLTVMRRLIVAGMTPADAAVKALAYNGKISVAKVCAPIEQRADIVKKLLAAANGFDQEAVQKELRIQLSKNGVARTWEDLLVPVLVEVGAQWASTGNGIEVEHLLTEIIMIALNEHAAEQKNKNKCRPVVLACVGDEIHSLAIKALAAALAESGIPTTFLGARTPQQALNEVVRKSAPPAIFLWAQLKKNAQIEFVTQIPATRPAPRIILGGPGWSGKSCGSAVLSEGLEHAHEEIMRAVGA